MDPELKRAYADADWSDRLHVRLRWASCPFGAVVAALPADGRVLDLGCGHGVLGLLAALDDPGREVVGVDIDKGTARRRATRHSTRWTGSLTLRSDGEAWTQERWDAITIVDMLYLLGQDEALGLVGRAAEALAPGGVLVIKEMAERPRWKAGLNVVQEHVSTKVLRITEGDVVAVVPSTAIERTMAEAGLVVRRERIDRWFPHPHLLLVGQRSASGSAWFAGTNRKTPAFVRM